MKYNSYQSVQETEQTVLIRANVLHSSIEKFKSISGKTWLVSILLLISTALFDMAQAWMSFLFVVDNLLSIAFFIVLSSALAGYLEAANADKLISRIFSTRIIPAVFAAALFGALSPFCSCGVIPLIAAMLVAGVPLAAVMAFWIASPIMDPAMFIVTVAGLGLDFALVKTVSAVVIGLIAGFTTLAMQHLGYFKDVLKPQLTSGCAIKDPMSLSQQQPVWKIWHHQSRLQLFKSKSISMLIFLLKWLTLAYILESMMMAYIPAEQIAILLGGDSAWTIPLAAIVGVPTYLNGFAAIPLVAGLIDTGMMPGAALSFMLSGAMTSIPAALAVFSLVKKQMFAWYLILALVNAALAGWLYQLVLNHAWI